jgi:hypothetical protein
MTSVWAGMTGVWNDRRRVLEIALRTTTDRVRGQGRSTSREDLPARCRTVGPVRWGDPGGTECTR